MEYLFDIIDELLQQNGFEDITRVDEVLQKNGSFKFYAPVKDTPEQYLLIENLKSNEIPPVNEFLKSQSYIFNALDEVVNRPGFAKNVSFLLTLETSGGEKPNELLEKFILKIEEDPYFFKKLVLLYDPKTAEVIVSECKKTKQDIPKYFEHQINSIANFDSFVNGKNAIYKLVAQLYIKLPFVSLPLKKIERSNLLAEELQQAIQDEKLEALWKEVCAFNMDYDNKLSINANMKDLDELLTKLDIREEK